MMIINRTFLNSCLISIVVVVFASCQHEGVSNFKHVKADDFYGYIVLEGSAESHPKMVVPHGVFWVNKKDTIWYVARMSVSIVDCPMINGKQDEGTVYSNDMEFWILDDSNTSVFGPKTAAEFSAYIAENDLSIEIPSVPNSYEKYVNDGTTACDYDQRSRVD